MRTYEGCIHNLTTYMDDFSLSSESLPCLRECLGATHRHFQWWGVQINLRKSTLLKNSYATAATDDLQLATEHNYKLLGATTGWATTHSSVRDRLEKAKRTLDRIDCLQLPQGLLVKLTSVMVTPLLYGCEFAPLTHELRTFDQRLRRGHWGLSRTATNQHAVDALCLPSHHCTARGYRFMNVFRAIWHLGAADLSRKSMERVWTSFRASWPLGQFHPMSCRLSCPVST